MAEGQKALVSLHGYFWMLLGHYTRGSCKTRQCSSGSNKFRVLAQVPRCFSVTTKLTGPAKQHNMAEGQKASSLHGYFWMLLGHYTRGSCKTRQCSSGSNKFRVLGQVPRCFSVTTKLTGPAKQHNMAEGQKALVSLHGYFWMLLGHYTRGSCKTRQCSSGSNKFRVLAQVPPVASRSPPNSQAL